jgi:PleD family two-component response regulator
MTNDDTFSGDSLSDLFDEDDGKTESKPAPSAARMSYTTDSSSGDQVRSILIVDDDALSREMVRTVVEKLDYRALEASNGTAAVFMAKQSNPILIVLDINMPGKGGLDVLRELRDDSAFKTTPIHHAHRRIGA